MPTNSFTITSDASVQSPPLSYTSDASIQSPPLSYTSDSFVGTSTAYTSDSEIAAQSIQPTSALLYACNAQIGPLVIVSGLLRGPCQPCCAFDVLVPSDLDYGSSVYATQALSFVIDCPPGYVCQPGQFPVTITIPPEQIPPVRIVPGVTTLVLQGCKSAIVATIPPGSNQTQTAAIISSMQQQWAQQQAECNAILSFRPRKQVMPKVLPSACVGYPYSQTIIPFAGSGPYLMDVVGILPFGLSFDQTGPTTGSISGTTDEPGTTYVTVRAANNAGQFMDANYVLNVMGITNADSIPSGVLNTPFNYQLEAMGSLTTITFAVTSGNLPVGLTIDATGLISGTPTSSGTNDVTIQLTDTSGNNCLANITLVISGEQFVTPDIYSAAVSYFNMNLAAGLYRIRYINGALKYNAGQGWALNALGTLGYMVRYSLGDVFFPGTTSISFVTQSDVESANSGAHIDIVHNGGPIGVWLYDTIYPDNVPGNPNPTFSLTQLS